MSEGSIQTDRDLFEHVMAIDVMREVLLPFMSVEEAASLLHCHLDVSRQRIQHYLVVQALHERLGPIASDIILSLKQSQRTAMPAFISGSFLMHALLGERAQTKDSDLDIFVLFRHEIMYSDRPFHPLEKLIMPHCAAARTPGGYQLVDGFQIQHIVYYDYKNFKIQFIYVFVDRNVVFLSALTFVQQTFDLDIVMNVFDGIALHWTNEEAIYKKEATIVRAQTTVLKRIFKYLQKGCTVCFFDRHVQSTAQQHINKHKFTYHCVICSTYRGYDRGHMLCEGCLAKDRQSCERAIDILQNGSCIQRIS